MAGPTTNAGTQVYIIPCGIPSDPGLVLSANKGSMYFFRAPDDFILWGQGTHYVPVSSNIGTKYYFLECNVPSDVGLVLSANYGTHYYYQVWFNCVSFCDPIPPPH